MSDLSSQYLRSKGPFCQSCGMPLSRPEEFAMGADGFRINDYCTFCYANGSFTEPALTLQGMIDKCIAIVVRQGIMPVAQATTVMAKMLPRLKRWRTE